MNYGDFLYQVARLGIEGRRQDISSYLRRVARKIDESDAELASKLRSLTTGTLPAHSIAREVSNAMVPVDADSRLQLVKHEANVDVPRTPVLNSVTEAAIEQIIKERNFADDLMRHDLLPSRTALFVGPPGVGKTLTARWIAQRLNKTLLTLDLAAVMSSYLGKTGTNIRSVLDYAKSGDCVLFLDEFDAIAKRRDDDAEIGELKRLVNVLLQEIDDWPSSGLLLAATNHGDLLDPAIWRRFDMVVDFPMPSTEAVEVHIRDMLASMDTGEASRKWASKVLSSVWSRYSLSDITRNINQLRRQTLLFKQDLRDSVLEVVRKESLDLPKKEKSAVAINLVRLGMSKREAERLTDIDRRKIVAAPAKRKRPAKTTSGKRSARS
ncbi:MAG: AAA family ATPase [Alphaproteobacteria bacterium]|nr:AAA family ATPase [Alphaproteobacteria bacterium]